MKPFMSSPPQNNMSQDDATSVEAPSSARQTPVKLALAFLGALAEASRQRSDTAGAQSRGPATRHVTSPPPSGIDDRRPLAGVPRGRALPPLPVKRSSRRSSTVVSAPSEPGLPRWRPEDLPA